MDNVVEASRSLHMEEEIKKFKPKPELFGKTMVERWKYLDEEFREKCDASEQHYLAEANKILFEVINEIRVRVSNPDTTMNDLIKALDVISNKLNLAMGMPTNIGANVNVNLVKNMNDDELTNRINELEQHFLSSPSAPGSTLLVCESDPTPSLLSSSTSQEHSLSSRKGDGWKRATPTKLSEVEAE